MSVFIRGAGLLPRARPALAVLSVVAAAFGMPACQAAVTFQFSVDSHHVAGKRASNIPADSHVDQQVTLADGWIAVQNDRETTVYDFKNRRRAVLDRASRTFVDFSLYDVAGFRMMELQNRERTAAALAAAKIDAGTVAVAGVDNENLLSIRSRTAPGQVSVAASGDDVLVSGAGHELMRWSQAGSTTSPAELQRFVKFVRYTLGGHPVALDKLAGGGVIPAHLVLSTVQFWGSSTSTMTVSGLHQVDAPADPLAGAVRRMAAAPADILALPVAATASPVTAARATASPDTAGPALDALLDRVAAWTPAELAAVRSSHALQAGEVASDFQQGRVLDGALATMEDALMHSGAGPQYTPDQTALLRSDPAMMRFAQAMGASTREGITTAVDTLAQLRAGAPRKAYVLELFEANDRMRLGQPQLARTLFADVLRRNPALAGAYKDLGDLYLQGFDTPRAWRSWDLGRRLAPQLANFAAVNQFEQGLAQQYPEYF